MSVSLCQASLTATEHGDGQTGEPEGGGLAFLGSGVAFLGVAASGQPAFLGVAMAMIALGIVFIGKSRKAG